MNRILRRYTKSKSIAFNVRNNFDTVYLFLFIVYPSRFVRANGVRKRAFVTACRRGAEEDRDRSFLGRVGRRSLRFLVLRS